MLLQPFDMEVGAGTFHPATFLRAIGPEPWSAAYVQPSRRPTDGRYGENPNRLQHFYQYQVVIKPSPLDVQEMYLGSLAMLKFDPLEHDIRFVEDNWESPTLGALRSRAGKYGWTAWRSPSSPTFSRSVDSTARPVSVGAYLRARAHRHVLAGRRQPVRPDLGRWSVRPGELPRRLPSERTRDVRVQLRARGRGRAVRPVRRLRTRVRQAGREGTQLSAYEQVLRASHTFNLLERGTRSR